MSEEDYKDWVRNCVIFWDCMRDCPFYAYKCNIKKCPYLKCSNCMEYDFCNKLSHFLSASTLFTFKTNKKIPNELIKRFNNLKASLVKCLNKKRYLTRMKRYELFWLYIKPSYP